VAAFRVIALAVAAAALSAACSSSSSHQERDAAELAAVASLQRTYSGLVTGLDVRPENTLVVSLDLQRYIETDDETIAAMKRDALVRWRSAWISAHPREHAVIHVRFIDFIGRKVAEESAKV
jgi:hypothetical protein